MKTLGHTFKHRQKKLRHLLCVNILLNFVQLVINKLVKVNLKFSGKNRLGPWRKDISLRQNHIEIRLSLVKLLLLFKHLSGYDSVNFLVSLSFHNVHKSSMKLNF